MSDDLVKRLRYGIVEHRKRWSGDTHADLGGSVDYDATTDMLHEAAERIEELEAKLAKAVEHLEWFIENDETNRGDEPMPERRNQTWDEINSYWIEHLDAAIAFVLELKGEK